MHLTLKGKILTPIITKKIVFEIEGCRTIIISPKRRYITKSHKNRRIYPFSFTGYLGTITLSCRCQNEAQIKAKLKNLLMIEHIGRFWREGFGKIEWLQAKIGTRTKSQKSNQYRRVKIRKGIPHHFSDHVTRLIRYALLHDFVHTPRHQSKIYIEPDLNDTEYLRQHHDHSDDPLIQQFQRYDRIAASMTRRIRSPRTNRYTWEAKETIDFKSLAKEIEKREHNIWKLYQFIYESKNLHHVNESLHHGHSSLRYHLLLIVNLIVQDFLRGAF